MIRLLADAVLAGKTAAGQATQEQAEGVPSGNGET